MKAKFVNTASLVFIGCIIVLLLVTSYMDLQHSNTPEHFVSEGLIDLSEIKDIKQPIKLDGEWTFYESQLIDYAELLDESKKTIVKVPDKWNSYIATRQEPKSFGYGTFHLRIKLSDAQMKQVVGFKIQNIGMSNKVIVNGQVISSSGKTGTNSKNYEIGNVPNYVFFSPEHSELDVLIQVTNFDYSPYSGIVSSILFGPQEAIEKAKISAYGYEFFFLGASTVIGLLFFVLYLFRSNEKYLLYFSLYSLTGAFYILTHGEKIWFHIFEGFDYLLFTKLQYLSAALSTLGCRRSICHAGGV